MIENKIDFVLEEDLNSICNDTLIDFDKFKNKTIMITGATGAIGAQIVRSLVYIDKKRKLNLKIIGLIRNIAKAKKLFGTLLEQDNIEMLVCDIIDEIKYDLNIDFIIHCASITTSSIMVKNPVDTIETSIYGTNNVLKLAKEKSLEGFIYISSMEAYGLPDGNLDKVTEKDLGYIDPLKVRSNYPESKRMCESLCIAYLTQYNIPIKIVRLAQTFGAGIDFEFENRVFAQFAKSVIQGKDIVLHTHGNSEGNYCYTSDAVKAILMLLTKGVNGEAYNVVNESTHTTIKDMANLVANSIANGRIKVVFDIPQTGNTHGYAPETRMKLSAHKLEKLGWKPQVGLEEAYSRLIQSFKHQINLKGE